MCVPAEDDFDKLSEATVPEMQRSDLAPVVLQLKALGIANILRFNFLSVGAFYSHASTVKERNIMAL